MGMGAFCVALGAFQWITARGVPSYAPITLRAWLRASVRIVAVARLMLVFTATGR